MEKRGRKRQTNRDRYRGRERGERELNMLSSYEFITEQVNTWRCEQGSVNFGPLVSNLTSEGMIIHTWLSLPPSVLCFYNLLCLTVIWISRMVFIVFSLIWQGLMIAPHYPFPKVLESSMRNATIKTQPPNNALIYVRLK